MRAKTEMSSNKKAGKQVVRINIQPSIALGDNPHTYIFRKPKKAIKMFPITSQMSSIDQNHDMEEIKERLLKMKASTKNWKSCPKTEEMTYIPLSERTKQKIFDSYTGIRKNEMFALCLPLTDRKETSKKKLTLQLHLQQVEKIRSRTHIKKIAIPQKLFADSFASKNSYSVGFKGRGLRTNEKAHSNKNVSTKQVQKQSSIIEQHRRNRSQASLQSNFKVVDQLLRKSSRANVCSPKANAQYRSKSRLVKVWNTVGVHKHCSSVDK